MTGGAANCYRCANTGIHVSTGDPCNCFRGSKFTLIQKKKGQGGRDLGRKSKYNAERVGPEKGDDSRFAGRSFDSKLERDTFGLLLLEERSGEIKDIEQQTTVYLTQARISYRVDFRVFDLRLGEHVYIEAKGFVTEPWQLKVKLWEVYGPARLRIYVAGSAWPYCKKEIIPSLLNG